VPDTLDPFDRIDGLDRGGGQAGGCPRSPSVVGRWGAGPTTITLSGAVADLGPR